jgi:hypothetical protein
MCPFIFILRKKEDMHITSNCDIKLKEGAQTYFSTFLTAFMDVPLDFSPIKKEGRYVTTHQIVTYNGERVLKHNFQYA